MSEVSERYERVADGFGARLSGVGAEHWAVPTPCSEWDVRTLVTHVIATHGRVLASLTGSAPVEVDAEAELIAQWSPARCAVAAALADPAQSQSIVGGMFGEQSFESLVSRLLCADTLFHTWDLARATGQDEHLDPDAAAKALELLTPLDETIRRPGGFATKIPPPPGADVQTHLLCFGGRRVEGE